AVSASSRGRSVVFAMILPPELVPIISIDIYRKFKPRAISPDRGAVDPSLFETKRWNDWNIHVERLERSAAVERFEQLELRLLKFRRNGSGALHWQPVSMP
ncbi:MAG TPA: hypothetical protein VIM04_05710, partial [Candidatus Binatia bacterium]